MVRHWTTDQRAWLVARKMRGDTLAQIQACFIQLLCMCLNNHCRPTMPTSGPGTPGMSSMPLLLTQRRIFEGWSGTFAGLEPVRTGGKNGKQEGKGSWVFWPSKTLMTWVGSFNLFNVYVSQSGLQSAWCRVSQAAYRPWQQQEEKSVLEQTVLLLLPENCQGKAEASPI